jgi:hypothetical protein
MSWQTVLRGHLVDAGAAVTPAITTVRMTIPQSPVRQITCEYLGDGPSPWGGDTIATRQVGERFEIKVWLPVATFDLSPAEDMDTLIQAVKEQIKSRLEADGQLGDPVHVERLDTEDAKADWEQWRNNDGTFGQIVRTLTIPLVVGLNDVSVFG